MDQVGGTLADHSQVGVILVDQVGDTLVVEDPVVEVKEAIRREEDLERAVVLKVLFTILMYNFRRLPTD